MQSNKLAVFLMGSIIGVMLGMLLGVSFMGITRPDVTCPPAVDAAHRIRLFYSDLPPENTVADLEFSDACGFEWEDPVRLPSFDKGL